MVTFENVKQRLCCSQPGVGTRPRDRSATASRAVRAELLRRYGRGQIKLALRTSGSARRGTTLCPLWTRRKYASGFMTHNEVTNTRQWPEQQTPRLRYVSEICPSHHVPRYDQRVEESDAIFINKWMSRLTDGPHRWNRRTGAPIKQHACVRIT